VLTARFGGLAGTAAPGAEGLEAAATRWSPPTLAMGEAAAVSGSLSLWRSDLDGAQCADNDDYGRLLADIGMGRRALSRLTFAGAADAPIFLPQWRFYA
jgi:hypothetical protein